MPQKVLGIDLGSFSVRITELEVGFRRIRLLGVHQARVDAQLPWLEGAVQAAAALRRDRELTADSVCVAIPGDQVLIHSIEVPFEDERKIASVIGYELEAQLPWGLEELCFDYALAGSARSGTGSLVVGAAVRREEIARLIERLRACGLDPQVIAPAPLVYAAFRENQGSVAWVDFGHLRTNVAVVSDGALRFARTLSYGGHNVTAAMETAFRVPYDQAEALKHSGDFDADSGVVSSALGPLVRDLRISLEACHAQTGTRVDRVLLCGGSSRLAGLAPALARILERPVELGRAALGADRNAEELPPEATVACACALRAAEKARIPNLRSGEMAYRGDVSFVRAKVGQLVALAVLVIAFAVASGFASLLVLKRERRQLADRMATETRALFGKELFDAKEVSRQLKGNAKDEGPPLPQKSAFDVLVDLSTRTPSGKELRVDISELDIKPKKTYVKATTDSAAAVDALADAWKQSDCVGEIQKGRVADASGGQEKQFTLTVDTRCF